MPIRVSNALNNDATFVKLLKIHTKEMCLKVKENDLRGGNVKANNPRSPSMHDTSQKKLIALICRRRESNDLEEWYKKCSKLKMERSIEGAMEN